MLCPSGRPVKGHSHASAAFGTPGAGMTSMEAATLRGRLVDAPVDRHWAVYATASQALSPEASPTGWLWPKRPWQTVSSQSPPGEELGDEPVIVMPLAGADPALPGSARGGRHLIQ